MTDFRDITGMRFGKLVAVSLAGKQKREMTWLCHCDCGKETVVRLGNLKSGNTKSCRCLKK